MSNSMKNKFKVLFSHKIVVRFSIIYLIILLSSFLLPWHLVPPIYTRILDVQWEKIPTDSSISYFVFHTEVEVINFHIYPVKITHPTDCGLFVSIIHDSWINPCISSSTTERYNAGPHSLTEDVFMIFVNYNESTLPVGEYRLLYSDVPGGDSPRTLREFGVTINISSGLPVIVYDPYVEYWYILMPLTTTLHGMMIYISYSAYTKGQKYQTKSFAEN
ncbi:MAG: hypothetical protein INQ03_02245 [Candidatus Heimdallarchaeota archaeon]|nr:hypothetical protein [Candidatus Heimdallarchaeota archaeon]